MSNSKASCPGEMPPWIAIAPMRLQFVDSYHECLEQVCKEGLYLSTSCAPGVEMSRRFVSRLLEDAMPMSVALIPGMQVVGWCDMYRIPYEGQGHVGRLGMGIRVDYREQGIGTVLMERVLRNALLAGLERVELEVFSANQRAINLYKKFGFEVEGTRRRARKINGVYDDVIMMGKLVPRTAEMFQQEKAYLSNRKQSAR